MLGVEWSDWVIRFPTGGGSTEGTIIVILVVALLAYALVRGTVSIGDKLTPMLWSLVTFFAFLLIVIAVGRAQDDQPGGASVEDEISEDDCADQFLSRCPPDPGDGSG